MSSSDDQVGPLGVEIIHMVVLAIAALGLLVGLVNRDVVWVKGGVAVILLLPPLRVATSVIHEARARRYEIAAMGLFVLAILLFSRRIS